MLETFRNAFKVKDIRKKIIYTFFMLIVIRLGSQLPVPGVVRYFRSTPGTGRCEPNLFPISIKKV